MVSERDNGITIVKLGPGQSIRATCIATLVPFLAFQRVLVGLSVVVLGRCVQGVGKMHTKWSPVGTAVFQYEHDIRLNPGLYHPESAAE